MRLCFFKVHMVGVVIQSRWLFNLSEVPLNQQISTVATRQKHLLGRMVYLIKTQANCVSCDIPGRMHNVIIKVLDVTLIRSSQF